METLIELNGRPEFLIDIVYIDFTAKFKVYDTSELNGETYFSGYIKWDGSCHIWFGENYFYMDGRRGIEKLKIALDAVYDLCSKNIKDFGEI